MDTEYVRVQVVNNINIMDVSQIIEIVKSVENDFLFHKTTNMAFS